MNARPSMYARDLGPDYPLRFASPAERVQLCELACAPFFRQLVALRNHTPRPVMLVRRAGDTEPGGLWAFDSLPGPLPDWAEAHEKALLEHIDNMRSRFLAGLIT